MCLPPTSQIVNFKFLYSTVSTLKPEQTEKDTSVRRLVGCEKTTLGIFFSVTDGWDGLHELILLELEEDGGLPCTIQPQCHHPDLHLWTDVHPVVLNTTMTISMKCGSLAWWQQYIQDPGVCTLVKVTGMPASS